MITYCGSPPLNPAALRTCLSHRVMSTSLFLLPTGHSDQCTVAAPCALEAYCGICLNDRLVWCLGRAMSSWFRLGVDVIILNFFFPYVSFQMLVKMLVLRSALVIVFVLWWGTSWAVAYKAISLGYLRLPNCLINEFRCDWTLQYLNFGYASFLVFRSLGVYCRLL